MQDQVIESLPLDKLGAIAVYNFLTLLVVLFFAYKIISAIIREYRKRKED